MHDPDCQVRPHGGYFFVTAAMTSPLSAQAEDALSVKGYFTQSMSLFDIDDRAGRSFDDEIFTQNAEIHFTAKKKQESGTTLSAHIQLEAASEDHQIDEHFISVTADWGKMILGSENGVGHLMQVRAPSFVPGLKMYDNSLLDEGLEDAYNLLFDADLTDESIPKVLNDAHMSTKLEHISGDANKFSFITPKVGGLQLGVSFTPNNKDRNGSQDDQSAALLTDDLQEDILELGLTYSGRYGGVKYKFGYSTVEGGTLRGAGAGPESSSAGLRVAWADYVVGLNQSIYEGLADLPGDAYSAGKIETQNISLRKGNADTQWGIGWTSSDEEDVAATPGVLTEYEEIRIGGGRKLADGVRLGYYYTQTEVNRPKGTTALARGSEISALGMTIDLRF